MKIDWFIRKTPKIVGRLPAVELYTPLPTITVFLNTVQISQKAGSSVYSWYTVPKSIARAPIMTTGHLENLLDPIRPNLTISRQFWHLQSSKSGVKVTQLCWKSHASVQNKGIYRKIPTFSASKFSNVSDFLLRWSQKKNWTSISIRKKLIFRSLMFSEQFGHSRPVYTRLNTTTRSVNGI